MINPDYLWQCSFFFSSRRRHTRWTGDWSSDVCSSDLPRVEREQPTVGAADDHQIPRHEGRRKDLARYARAPSRLSRTPIERDDLSVERSDRYEGAVGAYSAGKRAARIDPPRFPPVGRFKAGDGTVLGRGVDAVDREGGEQYGVSRLAYARLPQRAHRYARGQFRQFGHLRSGRARTSGEEHHAGEEEPPHQPSPSASSLRRSASRSGPAPVFSSAALYAARASERLFCVVRMSPRCEA